MSILYCCICVKIFLDPRSSSLCYQLTIQALRPVSENSCVCVCVFVCVCVCVYRGFMIQVLSLCFFFSHSLFLSLSISVSISVSAAPQLLSLQHLPPPPPSLPLSHLHHDTQGVTMRKAILGEILKISAFVNPHSKLDKKPDFSENLPGI